MIVTPPRRRRKPRPVALLSPGWRSLTVETSAGTDTYRGPGRVLDALEKLSGHVCYTVQSPARMRYATSARLWSAEAWRGRVTAVRLDGSQVVVRSLRGALEGSEDPFGDLQCALDWFGAYGVPPSSLSAMSWSLWRSSLSGDLRIGAPRRLGSAAFYGGRQAAREARTYSHMASADLVAAYPHSMARLPYALALRRVSTATVLDPDTAGLIRGTVGVPSDLPFGPVPLRVAKDMISFPTGYVHGAWTWAEANAAEGLGCTVLVDECWAPSSEADIFGAWWRIAVEGRDLPGHAARIAKAAANSLWGLFGMRGDDTELIRWADDAGTRPMRIARKPRTLPHAWTAHIAAETASRVRVRVLKEIYDFASYGRGSPVHIDTDGMILRRSALADMPTEGEPGEFRRKADMRKVDIRAPQVYRYQCTNGCGQTHPGWHYSVAGVPADAAKRVFDKVGRLGCSVSFTGTDLVLPGYNALDVKTAKRAELEARSVMGMLS